MDEQQAILYLKQGDPAGMEFLVQQYYYPALHTAYLIVRDESLAEDIVQTFFLDLGKKINRFDENLPFRPWFMRCIANASINALDGRRRFVSLERTHWHPDGELHDFLDEQPSPEDQVITAEMRSEVWDLLGRLNPYQRAVIVMRYYLQLKESEMELALNKPRSSIKWWLRSAKQRLRQLFQIQEADKTYLNDVNGTPQERSGEVDDE